MTLVGDIGGTNTRLALHDGGDLRSLRSYPSASAPDLLTLIRRYLEETGEKPSAACLAVAGPVVANRAEVTNLPWVVDGPALQKELGVGFCRVINDFHAAALGVAVAPSHELLPLGGTPGPAQGVRVVMGAGTGLGVALLVHDGRQLQPLSTEGGHRDFAPRTEEEVTLWRMLREQYGHVSYERVLSGRGLAAIHRSLVGSLGATPATEARLATEDPAAVIAELGLSGADAACVRALQMFVEILGAEAGNLGLGALARGGVFVAGGMAPRLLPLMTDGRFRRAFEDKGQMAHVARTLPAYLCLSTGLGLVGAAEEARRIRS